MVSTIYVMYYDEPLLRLELHVNWDIHGVTYRYFSPLPVHEMPMDATSGK
jgi:hypothetical protein